MHGFLEKKTGEFATARGGYGGYGAYGFPSLEGALLSIAFLTFAVFLIDLIQVIPHDLCDSLIASKAIKMRF